MGTLTALLLASMSAPAAWPADEQDPTGMEVNPVVKVEPPTAAQEAEFAAADRAAQEHYLVLLAVRDAHLTGDRAVVDSARAALDESTANLVEQSGTDEFGGDSVLSSCPDGDCSWSYVTRITHSAQTTSYWCGPATGVMLVKGWSSPTQSSMADAMGTTTAGTGWATGPNAPIPSGINAYNGARRDYTGVGVPSGGGTSTDRTTFQQRLVSNTDAGRGIASNIWQGGSTPPSQRLHTGYPSYTVKHIFAVRGYSNYGTSAYYVDPASGGTGISWGDDVPAYGSATTTKLMPLLGARGYVW